MPAGGYNAISVYEIGEAPTPTPPTPTPTPDDYELLGCFADSQTNGRIMGDKTSSSTMTAEVSMTLMDFLTAACCAVLWLGRCEGGGVPAEVMCSYPKSN